MGVVARDGNGLWIKLRIKVWNVLAVLNPVFNDAKGEQGGIADRFVLRRSVAHDAWQIDGINDPSSIILAGNIDTEDQLLRSCASFSADIEQLHKPGVRKRGAV
jgi:hypothetical protein